MLPDDQVVIQEVSLSNWELLLEWLHIDPMDGTHPMWAAAGQSVGPLFDTLTAPFSAFFALLERSDFAGWLDILLACAGIAGGVWFSVWVLSALTVGARRFFLESRVRDNISSAAMFTPFYPVSYTHLEVYKRQLIITPEPLPVPLDSVAITDTTDGLTFL